MATQSHLKQVHMDTLPSHQAAMSKAHQLVYSSAPQTIMVVKPIGKPTAPKIRLNRPGPGLFGVYFSHSLRAYNVVQFQCNAIPHLHVANVKVQHAGHTDKGKHLVGIPYERHYMQQSKSLMSRSHCHLRIQLSSHHEAQRKRKSYVAAGNSCHY